MNRGTVRDDRESRRWAEGCRGGGADGPAIVPAAMRNGSVLLASTFVHGTSRSHALGLCVGKELDAQDGLRLQSAAEPIDQGVERPRPVPARNRRRTRNPGPPRAGRGEARSSGPTMTPPDHACRSSCSSRSFSRCPSSRVGSTSRRAIVTGPPSVWSSPSSSWRPRPWRSAIDRSSRSI